MTATKEPQNQSQIDDYQQRGPATMGPWTSHIWRSDPRHLLFLLARYKFCAKMLSGAANVLEIGCGDAFGTPLVLQTVRSVHCVDFEPLVVNEARKHMQAEFVRRCSFSVHDILQGPVSPQCDAGFSLDVIEHIASADEPRFIGNIAASLKPNATFIIGTPNVAASQHASAASAEGHVNLKSAETLRRSMLTCFQNVYIFSMNDEVVHTGYSPMAHYILGMGVGVTRQK